ncbi:hypothetical protein AN618_15900 [Fervidicola ferrireducens]|uniref:Regulatory protein YycH domain-containing protein n=1 Tax=Fervidicola ferrireducens TaxID=520764 RepID=A0A140L7N4_9FIRM|nr:two-component system activity regulator YycH [Fervidicola ferrireducens]KXG76559.1 hypothetical protein AN618_15900 [Fervidicola ferrireducens]
MKNRDFFLGLLLALLVGTSLFLSGITWWRLYGEYGDIQAENSALSVVDLADVITPDRVVLHFGQDMHSVLYPNAPFYRESWDFARKVLHGKELVEVKNAKLDDENLRQKVGMELFFPVPLPVEFLTKVFNMNITQQAIPQERLVNSMMIIEDDGLSVFFKGSSGEFYGLKNRESSFELKELLERVRLENPPVYTYLPPAKINVKFEEGIYVPVSTEQNDLPVLSLKHEKMPPQSTIAQFFPDFSATRKIEEKDGAVVYTDGNRGLRIYPTGALEYSRPLTGGLKTGSDFYEALKIAANFINTHGGWPQDVYLSGYKVAQNQRTAYTFNFGIRIKGLPLLSQSEYLTVTVEENQVSRYFRNIVKENKVLYEIQPISPIQALDAAIATFNLKEITSLELSYLIFEDALIPVWTVETRSGRIFINAKNGMAINF